LYKLEPYAEKVAYSPINNLLRLFFFLAFFILSSSSRLPAWKLSPIMELAMLQKIKKNRGIF